MGKHRSIGERMQRAKSLASRREAALDWAANWLADQDETISALEQAIRRGDLVAAGRYCGQIKTISDKSLVALPKVIDALADEDAL